MVLVRSSESCNWKYVEISLSFIFCSFIMFTYIHIHVLDDPQEPLPYETFVQYIQRKGQRQGTQSEIRMLTKNISEYEILCSKNASNTSVRSAHSVNNKNVLGVLREDKDRMLSETFSEKHENELLKLNSTNLKEEPAPLHTDNRYPVIPTGLGYFHKVSSERLKLKNGTSKARVTCTCETFRFTVYLCPISTETVIV